MTTTTIGILGTGSYLPAREVTNDEIEARVPGASAEWIRCRTDILARRYAAPGEDAADLAVHAGRAALDQARVSPDNIRYVIVSTTTAEQPIPSIASRVQHALGIGSAAAFDLNVACSGFVAGLAVADGLIGRCPDALALVIGTDVYTRFLDFDERSTSVLFGDAAGATVVGSVAAPDGFLRFELLSRGDAQDLIWTEYGSSTLPSDIGTHAAQNVHSGHVLRMKGRNVTEFVLDSVPTVIASLLKSCAVDAREVAHFVPHQANGPMVRELAETCGLGAARTHLLLDHTGNIGSASVPVALDEANRSGDLKDGDLVLLAGFGAGMAVGAGLLRWPASRSGRGDG